jgi:hypothetical protein
VLVEKGESANDVSMSIPCDEAMREAFRRAQMRGRVFPQVCDFPPSVSADAVEQLYLPSVRACNSSSSSYPATTPPNMGISPVRRGPLEMTEFSREGDDAAFLTNGGDAWAAVLLLHRGL